MIYVSLPDSIGPRQLPFYLAMEEYLARQRREDDLFFMWQVEPTVIFGRNQVIDNEVNIDYCRSNGIRMYRRKSGGGCVFANMDNIMFSYITTSPYGVETTFQHYTDAVARMLQSLGLNASASSRNDVMIDGLKVSGNAFYHIPPRSIVHGTMLFDTDMAHMAAAITPSTAKLSAKGVASVRSHITTLSRHISMDIEAFKGYARTFMCQSTLELTDEDVKEIEKIERPYYDPDWIMGHRRRHNASHSQRIEGVGEFNVEMSLSPRDIIEELNLTGDFFLTADLDSELIDHIKGTPLDPDELERALADVSVGNVIYGMNNQQLIDLLSWTKPKKHASTSVTSTPERS